MSVGSAWRQRFAVRLLACVLAGGGGNAAAAPAPAPVSLRANLPPIAFVRRPPRSRHGTNAIMCSTTHGEGSEILVLDRPSDPGAKPRVIFASKEGYVFDLSPSYDGRTLLMTYREKPDAPFHVWEIGVDGAGLRQLTDGPWHDFNPIYYPDGRIVFCSSRVESYSLCQNFLASALYVCRGDGSDIRRIDFTSLCSMAPAVLPDGSIVFTRWEYNDKNIFSWQGLWTILPDGRQLKLYYGNTLTVPNSRYGPRPVPGTNLVAITMTAHHHEPVGDIALVDRSRGLENPAGCRQITFATSYRVTQGRDWQDKNWGPGDKFYPWTFTDPWPLDARRMLVAYGGYDVTKHKDAEEERYLQEHPQFRLFVLGTDGRLDPLYGEEGKSFFCPVALAERPRPQAIASEIPAGRAPGTFFVADVYQGLEAQGVKRGQVKELRVWEQVPKKYNTEGPRYHDHYPVIGYGTYYVKKIHGTVPVEPDGSVYFEAPSGAELYFQALDEHGKEISRMGSVTQITPGERASCGGCHDSRSSAPPVGQAGARRLDRSPAQIRPPPWGAGPVDYVSLVQPVLDRYCTSCHAGAKQDGNVDLSGDKTRFFSMSYENLCLGNWVAYYYINQGPTGNFPALATGSWVSRLTKLLEDRHAGVDVDAESRRRIYVWIDSNVCYYPTWDMTRPHTQGGRDPCFRIRNDDGVYPKERGHSRALEPMPWFAAIERIAEARGWRGGIESRELNLTRPEWSPLLLEHLARAAGGRAPEAKAVFQTTADPDYVALLSALQEGARSLAERPRMDMPGAKPLPQARDFGRVF